MGDLLPIEERRKKYAKVKADPEMIDAMRYLREQVENQGAKPAIHLVGSVTRVRELTDIQVVQVPPWVIGYKVEPIDPANGMFERTILLKLPGERILEIPEQDREGILAAVFETMLDESNEFPAFDLAADDCIEIKQRFGILFWHENSPGVVVPGKKG